MTDMKKEYGASRAWMAALAALVIASASCSGNAGGQGKRPADMAAPVTAETAAQKDVPVELSAIGSVEPYSSVMVKSRVGGLLEKVHFQEGGFVKEGDLLFTIDPAPFEAALKRAKAALSRDRAQLSYARKTAANEKTLLDKKLTGREDYDRKLAEAEALAATVEADKAAVTEAELELGYCYIKSPISGRAGSILVKKGNLVSPSDQGPLVVINQVEPIYVDFTVPSQYLDEIRKRMSGSELTVLASGPGDGGTAERGVLTFMDNMVDESTGMIHLKASFDNKDGGLWPGAFMSVKLRLSTLDKAVVVPSRAIMDSQTGRLLFVIRDDMTVEARPVETGYESGGETVIKKGLSAGERVVTDGQLRLVEGSKVLIKGGVESPERSE